MTGDRGRSGDRSRWNLLLLIPALVPLFLPLYDRLDPQLFGFPFFYWGQVAFAVLAIVCMSIVHVRTKRRP